MERSRDWMFQAEGDLDQARVSLQHAAYDWASFAAQQAAEKAAKSVFNRLGAEAWGHSVTELLRGLSQHTEVPDGLLDAARELDKAYITSCYPDALPAGAPRSFYTLGEAERMVDHAQRILQFCSDYLASFQP